jgi:hypothetical protein
VGTRRRHAVAAAAVIVAVVVATLMAPGVAEAGFASAPVPPALTVSAAPYFTCQAAVTASAPSVYYKLAETTGPSATDSSGHGDTGTYQGGVTYGTPGACKRDGASAVTLNGSTGYLSTSTQSANPQVFTLELWFRTTTARGGKLIGFGNARTGASGEYDRHLYMTNSGQVVFGVYPGQVVTVTSAAAYNNGAWHLVDATLGPAGMALYLDGQPVGTNPDTAAQSYNGWWRLGYDNLAGWASVPTSAYFAGSLAQAAVYPTALTAAQIADHYRAGT